LLAVAVVALKLPLEQALAVIVSLLTKRSRQALLTLSQ
jgi:hypothetical protein